MEGRIRGGEEMEKSAFNPFVWAYTLVNDEKKYKRNAVEMAEFYAKYHSWSEEFLSEVITEIIQLRNN